MLFYRIPNDLMRRGPDDIFGFQSLLLGFEGPEWIGVARLPKQQASVNSGERFLRPLHVIRLRRRIKT